jgi:glycosyltransferase involved in cell wall biosynthesis
MERLQVWVILPSAASILPHLDAEKVIYYCVDEWSEFSFLDADAMREMERQVIAQSDLVFASARALYESRRAIHPRTHLIPHGVDGEHFERARSAALEVAPELRDLPRPVVGFWGALHDWIDLDLIRCVAERHPEWSIALVGHPEVDTAGLARLPNVHLVGGRPYAALPGYAKGFDAAILPFKINRLTESVNPIKLREYLAAGLPVVSTALPEARAYGDLVRIGATPEAFVRELEAAVADTSDAAALRRMEAVRGDTWVARVERMSELVEELDSA